jgi:hypothetical protein
MFLYNSLEDKLFWTEWYQALPEFNLLLIFFESDFYLFIFPSYLNCAIFSKHLLAMFRSWFSLNSGDETATYT